MRYFIHLGYDGSEYRGWQRQGNDTVVSVQETIEKTLHQLIKKEVTVFGCGRTDAGVHASQYVMHINLDEEPSFDLKFRLNKNLPDDIAVFEIIEVSQKHHCRFDAVARTYDYFIHWKKDPVLMRYSSFYEDLKVDFDKIQKVAALLKSNKDFKAVCKQPDLYDSAVCEVSNCEVFYNEAESRMRFTITANRFLRGMVRLCVFYLLKVGIGEMSFEEFEQILKQEKDLAQKQPALPNGLFLSKVEYPYINFQQHNSIMEMMKRGLS